MPAGAVCRRSGARRTAGAQRRQHQGVEAVPAGRALQAGSAETSGRPGSGLPDPFQLNDSLARIIDEQTEPWGITVTTVEILSRDPAAIQLRYLQTLLELGGEKSTIVFPLPMDLIKPFLGERRQADGTLTAPEPDLSAHAEALRGLLNGPEVRTQTT